MKPSRGNKSSRSVVRFSDAVNNNSGRRPMPVAGRPERMYPSQGGGGQQSYYPPPQQQYYEQPQHQQHYEERYNEDPFHPYHQYREDHQSDPYEHHHGHHYDDRHYDTQQKVNYETQQRAASVAASDDSYRQPVRSQRKTLGYNPLPHEKKYYDALFRVADMSNQGQNHDVLADEAFEFLSLSRLPPDRLRIVLNMANYDNAKKLSKEKFYVAIRLIQLYQNNQMVKSLDLTVDGGDGLLKPAFFFGISGIRVPLPPTIKSTQQQQHSAPRVTRSERSMGGSSHAGASAQKDNFPNYSHNERSVSGTTTNSNSRDVLPQHHQNSPYGTSSPAPMKGIPPDDHGAGPPISTYPNLEESSSYQPHPNASYRSGYTSQQHTATSSSVPGSHYSHDHHHESASYYTKESSQPAQDSSYAASSSYYAPSTQQSHPTTEEQSSNVHPTNSAPFQHQQPQQEPNTMNGYPPENTYTEPAYTPATEDRSRTSSPSTISFDYDDPYFLSREERHRYEKVFPHYQKENAEDLNGPKHLHLFTRSSLEEWQIHLIWYLVVHDSVTERLSLIEFILAIHLITCATEKKLPLPQTLPRSLQMMKDNEMPSVRKAPSSSPAPPPPVHHDEPMAASEQQPQQVEEATVGDESFEPSINNNNDNATNILQIMKDLSVMKIELERATCLVNKFQFMENELKQTKEELQKTRIIADNSTHLEQEVTVLKEELKNALSKIESLSLRLDNESRVNAIESASPNMEQNLSLVSKGLIKSESQQSLNSNQGSILSGTKSVVSQCPSQCPPLSDPSVQHTPVTVLASSDQLTTTAASESITPAMPQEQTSGHSSYAELCDTIISRSNSMASFKSSEQGTHYEDDDSHSSEEFDEKLHLEKICAEASERIKGIEDASSVDERKSASETPKSSKRRSKSSKIMSLKKFVSKNSFRTPKETEEEGGELASGNSSTSSFNHHKIDLVLSSVDGLPTNRANRKGRTSFSSKTGKNTRERSGSF